MFTFHWLKSSCRISSLYEVQHPWTSIWWYSILQRSYNLAFSLFNCSQISLGTYYMFQCVYQSVSSSSICLVVPTCRLKFLPQQTSSKELNPHPLSTYGAWTEVQDAANVIQSYVEESEKPYPQTRYFLLVKFGAKRKFYFFSEISLEIHWGLSKSGVNIRVPAGEKKLLSNRKIYKKI